MLFSCWQYLIFTVFQTSKVGIWTSKCANHLSNGQEGKKVSALSHFLKSPRCAENRALSVFNFTIGNGT